MAMAPTDPLRLYAGTASGHLYATADGGERWRDCWVRIPRNAVLTRLAVSPRSPDTTFAVYWLPAGGGGLLRSEDGGDTWKALALPGDPALRAIAIAPSAPDTLYVGGVEGVWRSDDGGDSWSPASGRARPVREVESLAVDPRFPLRVYAGTWRQAYRSLDGGVSWTLIGKGMDVDRDCFTVALSPLNPDTLFVGTCGWLYRSNDGGDLWANRKMGIPSDHRRIHTIAPDPLQFSEVWAGTRGGIYRSSDGADTFRLVRGDLSISTILTDPRGERVFAATEEVGVLVGGKSASFVERNSGLEATRVPAFDASPGGFGHLVAARTENPGIQSIWESQDAGRTWSRLAPGKRFEKVRFLRSLGTSQLQVLVIDGRGSWWRIRPEGKVEPLAAPPGHLDAVEVSRDSALVLAATDAGLFFAPAGKLTSEGASGAGPAGRRTPAAALAGGWRRLRSGVYTALAMEGDRFLALGPSTAFGGSPSALLAGEGGRDFKAEGLPGNVLDAALSPGDPAKVYAITRNRVFVSGDGGENWKAAPLTWPPQDLCAIVADPVGGDRAVAVDSHGGVLVGRNAEEPWSALSYDPWLDMIQDIRLSPEVPDIALVATLGHGIRVVPLNGPLPPPGPLARMERPEE